MNQISKQVISGIEDMVFSKNGIQFIALGNYALDFKKEYVFLGFTKNKTQVILGDIHMQGPNGLLKYNKKFAKVELRNTSQVIEDQCVPYSYYFLHTDGFRYSEKICEVVN